MIALSAAAFVALIAIAGVSYYALAEEATANTTSTATGTPGFFHHGMGRGNLTPEQQTAMKAKFDAVKAALDSNNYDAWLKAVGTDSPMTQKINQNNFSKLSEANGYMEKAQALMTELGIQGKGMFGFGGGHRGFGMMRNGPPNGAPANTNSSVPTDNTTNQNDATNTLNN